jgi:hypothetical protein
MRLWVPIGVVTLGAGHTLGAVLGILLLVGSCGPSDDYKLQKAAEWGRLAPFPKASSRIRVSTRGGMFSRQFYVRWEAAPEEIERFLAASPSLADVKPTRETGDTTEAAGRPVSWFDVTGIKTVRRFDFKGMEDQYWGHLWVDDDHHIVYVYVTYS